MIDHVAHELAAARLHYGHGTDNPRDEAAWLVGNALQISPQDLAKHLRDRPNATEIEGIRALVEERIQTRKPLAYLLNEAWFAGRRFYVDERVLVPRSLTAEFIAERFQPWIAPHAVRRALDLCTGSGCIAIALAHAFPGARVDATDLSTDALAVARINIERHGLHDRVRLIHADLFKGIPRKRYDLIVTNPPYVGAREMRTLPREYRHEPAAALQSGQSGLDAVVSILAHAADHLTPHGILVAEVGNSAPLLARRFPSVPFVWLETASGDSSVFLLTAVQLGEHHDAFEAAWRRSGTKRRAAPGKRRGTA